ncbi:hypothetical protein D3C80_1069910 [compost metagenome]
MTNVSGGIFFLRSSPSSSAHKDRIPPLKPSDEVTCSQWRARCSGDSTVNGCSLTSCETIRTNSESNDIVSLASQGINKGFSRDDLLQVFIAPCRHSSPAFQACLRSVMLSNEIDRFFCRRQDSEQPFDREHGFHLHGSSYPEPSADYFRPSSVSGWRWPVPPAYPGFLTENNGTPPVSCLIHWRYGWSR